MYPNHTQFKLASNPMTGSINGGRNYRRHNGHQSRNRSASVTNGNASVLGRIGHGYLHRSGQLRSRATGYKRSQQASFVAIRTRKQHFATFFRAGPSQNGESKPIFGTIANQSINDSGPQRPARNAEHFLSNASVQIPAVSIRWDRSGGMDDIALR